MIPILMKAKKVTLNQGRGREQGFGAGGNHRVMLTPLPATSAISRATVQ